VVSEPTATPHDADWRERAKKRWEMACRIAARHPGMDPGGVYHVLCNLERTPAERLRNAFPALEEALAAIQASEPRQDPDD
jgi:hypothetical protein